MSSGTTAYFLCKGGSYGGEGVIFSMLRRITGNRKNFAAQERREELSRRLADPLARSNRPFDEARSAQLAWSWPAPSLRSLAWYTYTRDENNLSHPLDNGYERSILASLNETRGCQATMKPLILLATIALAAYAHPTPHQVRWPQPADTSIPMPNRSGQCPGSFISWRNGHGWICVRIA